MRYRLKKLIEEYRTDPESDFWRLKHDVRIKHARLLTRISLERGDVSLAMIRARTLRAWYEEWTADGKFAMAYALMNRLSVVFRFGASILEDQECNRLYDVVEGMRFEQTGPRHRAMSVTQVKAFREAAHSYGWGSLALAQSLQFELLLSQKDVIGEWAPVTEEGETDIIHRGQKWLRGLRWHNIDRHLVLRHEIGKHGHHIEVNLRTAPMVLAELKQSSYLAKLGGPLIVNEIIGLPWRSAEFRRKWRLVAKLAGIPDDITNRDSKPAGMYRGGPERARIKRLITPRIIGYSLRMRAPA
jgi:hypothetical protein